MKPKPCPFCEPPPGKPHTFVRDGQVWHFTGRHFVAGHHYEPIELTDDDRYRMETKLAFDAILELIKNVQNPAATRFKSAAGGEDAALDAGKIPCEKGICETMYCLDGKICPYREEE